MSACCPLCGGPLDAAVLYMLRDRGVIGRGDQQVQLTGKEWEIFARLYERRPAVLSQEQLSDWLYQLEDAEPEIRIIDVFICRLRKKLKPLGVRIGNHWGKGYSLLLESEQQIHDVVQVVAAYEPG